MARFRRVRAVTPPSVLYVVPSFVPSTLAVLKALTRLHADRRIRLDVAYESLGRACAGGRVDVAVFCRNRLPASLEWLEWARRSGVPFIYDIDDNFFALGGPEVGAESLSVLWEFVRGAALLRVYSEPMLGRLRPENGSAVLVAQPVDWSLVSPRRHPVAPGDKVRVVYPTSRVFDDRLYELFFPALMRVIGERPGAVEAHFWGFKPPGMAGLRNVRHRAFDLDYGRYMRSLSRGLFDIGLAPALDDEFHDSKTDTKLREYGACGIAGVYSRTGLYSRCVEDGTSGLLVENTEESWRWAIGRLVADPSLRSAIRERARESLRGRCSQEAYERAWEEQIAEVASVAKPGRSETARGFGKVCGRGGAGGKPVRTSPTGRVSRVAGGFFSDPAAAWATARGYARVSWALARLRLALRLRRCWP